MAVSITLLVEIMTN